MRVVRVSGFLASATCRPLSPGAWAPVSLPLVEGRRVNDGVTAAVYRGALLGVQPDLLRDALRRPVVGADDLDPPGRAVHAACDVSPRRRPPRYLTHPPPPQP